MDGVIKTILHIDINSYFATMLQQENPLLRNRPLAVTKDQGRSCVIAASKEAKKFGVQTGGSLKDAQYRCPHILAVPVDFRRCLDATHRLKKIFNAISPHVYIYSLDEAFVDITDCREHLYPDALQLSQQIQQLIKDELGEWVTCNVGISHNRLLAKLASEVAPKGEVLTIDDHNKDTILAEVGFESVCGIGFRLGEKLESRGVTTPYLIRYIPKLELEQTFGPFLSKELLKIAWGEEPHLLSQIDRPNPHMKSVGRSITGYKLCSSEEVIKSVLYNLTEEVTYKVRKMNLAGRLIYISMRGEHGQRWHAHQTVQHQVRHTQEMFDILYHQLYKSWQRPYKIIKFSVQLGLLTPYQQTTFLSQWNKQESLAKAQDQITEKYGLFTLKSAAMLGHHTILPEVTGFLGDGKYLGLR